MKYRIRIENGKYRAEIGKENKFGKINWVAIENDNCDLSYSERYYNSVEEAETACREHHIQKNYGVKEDIAKEFEL